MRLRVAVVLVSVLGFFSSPAFAQLNLTGGVKGGVGFATFSSDDEEVKEVLGDTRTGLVIGGFVETPVTDMFSLVIEGLYSQKGARGSFTEDEIAIEASANVDYIEIPILAKFPFNTMSSVRPFVYGGIAPAFKTTASLKFEFPGGEDEDEEFTDNIKSFDFGLIFGGGVRIRQFGIEGRYNWGLTAIDEDALELSDHVKNGQFSLLFSYFFGGR